MAQELQKGILGFPSLLATAAGVFVASTTLVSLGQGVGVGGYSFIVARHCMRFSGASSR